MAEKTLEIGIIGLGKFGLRMATTLASMGHTVIGIDMSDARVQLAEELLEIGLGHVLPLGDGLDGLRAVLGVEREIVHGVYAIASLC